MPIYISYQCSVCRRIQDLLKDDVRARTNHCTITKGCLGYLFSLGEVIAPSQTPPVAGLDDWYPRGTERVSTTATPLSLPISLSSSARGAITLAVFLDTAEKDALADNQITLTFAQRRAENIPFTQFTFLTSSGQTTISGRDVNGITLRFDQSVIDENRVFVRVDGVARFAGAETDEFVLTPNTITFNTALTVGSTVSVLVYQEKNVIERDITFTQNEFYTVDADPTVWENVRYAEDGIIANPSVVGRRRWWLFTASGNLIQSLSASSRLRLVSNNAGIPTNEFGDRLRLLLSFSPYSTVDRVMNLVVAGDELNENFILTVDGTTSNRELFVDSTELVELYPPMQLPPIAIPSSDLAGPSIVDVTAEATGDSTSTIQTDENVDVQLPVKFVLGPI